MQRIEGVNATSVGLFTEGPPATTVTADWLNSIQEEIAHVIEQSGFSLLNAVNDTRTQLWESIAASIRPFDYVVNSQQTFQDAIERVGANQYKIKSAYKSILFRIRTGGYSMVAAASALSSAVDSWGYLETNATSHLEFESGAYIAMGATRGYLEIDTADCYLKNVWVKGESGTAVASLFQSFLLNNVRVTFDNCKCSNRNSLNPMSGFKKSNTSLHNRTSKYINCSSFTLVSTGTVYAFNGCENLSNCLAYDLESGTPSSVGFNVCQNLSNCLAYSITSSASGGYGFNGCDQVSSCEANTISSSGGTAYGFASCTQLSACKVNIISSNAGHARGFWSCDQISACIAETVDTIGAFDAYGFESCTQLSACKATDIDTTAGNAYGFESCQYGSSLWTDEAVNPNNDWIDSSDAQITNKVSTPDVWT